MFNLLSPQKKKEDFFILLSLSLSFLIQFHVKMSLTLNSLVEKISQDDITNFELKQKFDKASVLRNTVFHSNTMLHLMLPSYPTAECVFALAIALAFSFILICLLGAAGQHGCLFALNIYAVSGGDKGAITNASSGPDQ